MTLKSTLGRPFECSFGWLKTGIEAEQDSCFAFPQDKEKTQSCAASIAFLVAQNPIKCPVGQASKPRKNNIQQHFDVVFWWLKTRSNVRSDRPANRLFRLKPTAETITFKHYLEVIWQRWSNSPFVENIRSPKPPFHSQTPPAIPVKWSQTNA